MVDIKEIDEQLSFLESLENLTQIYGEIASTRMKKTRDSVISIREFLKEIQNIFDDVRASYVKEVRRLAKKKKIGKANKITFLAHNGKTVAVFLASKTGLYGEIIPATFRFFLQDLRTSNCEVAIVGRQGLALFIGSGEERPYTFFDLPEKEDLDYASLSEIVFHIVQYEEVRIYYGKYVSVVSQKPTRQIISSEIDITRQEKEAKRNQYIFEPSLEKILQFFETEMFASIFYQTFRESQLAKHASRILAMDAAYENIQKENSRLVTERLRMEHRNWNKKQLNSMPSIIANLGSFHI